MLVSLITEDSFESNGFWFELNVLFRIASKNALTEHVSFDNKFTIFEFQFDILYLAKKD